MADDHQMMRDGLRAILEEDPGMEVVGEAADGRGAVDLARELEPEVVVMDVGLPDLNGIEATALILAERPEVKVVALSMHADRRYVLAMLNAGASAYVIKNAAGRELVQAVRAVVAGKAYLSPDVAAVAIGQIVRPEAGDGSAFTRLSPRQREVLQLLAEGRSSKDIATTLGLSTKTVDSHRRQIMTCLDLHSIAELTKYAIREGLTSVEVS